MIPCPRCERFVGASSRECPFCAAALRDGPSPVGSFAGILLGLALFGCGTEPGSEEESSSSTTAVDTTTSTTEDPSATSSSSGQITSLDDDSVGEVAAYAGPGSFTDTFPDSTGDTESTGTGTGTDTGSSSGTGTGTDTGSSSGSSSGNG